MINDWVSFILTDNRWKFYKMKTTSVPQNSNTMLRFDRYCFSLSDGENIGKKWYWNCKWHRRCKWHRNCKWLWNCKWNLKHIRAYDYVNFKLFVWSMSIIRVREIIKNRIDTDILRFWSIKHVMVCMGARKQAGLKDMSTAPTPSMPVILLII